MTPPTITRETKMPLQPVVQHTSCFEVLDRNQLLSIRPTCGGQAGEVSLLKQACTLWASGQPMQIPSWQPSFESLWGQLFALGPADLASRTEEGIFIPHTTCLSS